MPTIFAIVFLLNLSTRVYNNDSDMILYKANINYKRRLRANFSFQRETDEKQLLNHV